ncbi:MAG: tyrosine-type recombinase/integrase [Erysipelotrichaceae bacterium]|nr:tyrosine-type recombinase/integrase [Erysipelotrichaceae bacterium]
MKYEFQSILQDVIIGLIKEKRELGYKYETEERQLKQLDKLAFQTNLEVITITREFAEEFIKIRPNEKQINSMNRVGTIRILAEYMNRKGYYAYVVPPLPTGSYTRTFTPHIFTDNELSRLFTAIDNYAASPSLDGQYYPQRRKYTVIFRILYSTGMRISEVLSLKVKNIDFNNNTFTILQAKNHSERIIPVHINTMNRLKNFILAEKIFRDDQYIFSNKSGNHIDSCTVACQFLKFLHLAHIPHPKDGPRVHDFRHTFCVHRLRDWVLEGRDINALFPYLCAYMGHSDTRCTEYYLRLTADLYPDIIHKSELYFNGDFSDE